MKNFNEIFYERVSYEEAENRVKRIIEKLTNCKKEEDFIDFCKQMIEIQNHIEEMYDYVDISNMRNLKDTFFIEEIEYWNTYKPKFDLLFLPFYKIILESEYKEKLMEKMPSNFFTIIEYQFKITSSEVVELKQKENELKNRYRELNRNKILWDGEEKTIAYLSSFFFNKDRSVRKKAHDALNDYYYEKQKEYDEIIYELIKVRNEMAKKLGFSNYVAYSLVKEKRFGYDYQDIHKFRDNVIKYIIPICHKLSIWQKEELGLETLEYYDTVFFSEMPEPLYKGKELLEKIIKSFGKLDEELLSLATDMLEKNYIDLLQREDKVNFAITNYLVESKMPTITGNFKNTYADIQTTTHEMGHSFQKYCAGIKDKEYIVSALLKYPTMEIAEMFSNAMELLSLRCVEDLFSKEDYQKYYFMQLYNLVCNLPYICLVDEFQEQVYSKENLAKEDIRKIWLELAKKYHLERANSGHKNLDLGGFFYRQSHIYLDPFYYIDYALSNFGAISIWNGCRENLQMFKEIGGVASYYSFKTFIQKYKMPNPFDEKVVEDISKMLSKELSKYKVKIK